MELFENPSIAAVLGGLVGAIVAGLISSLIWIKSRTRKKLEQSFGMYLLCLKYRMQQNQKYLLKSMERRLIVYFLPLLTYQTLEMHLLNHKR